LALPWALDAAAQAQPPATQVPEPAAFPASRVEHVLDKAPVEADSRSRVVEGENAGPGDFPWQVALILARSPQSDPFRGFFCGGSLIDWRWVLTAAHCTYKDNPRGRRLPPVPLRPDELNVYMGSVNFTGGQRLGITTIVRHPEYSHSTQDNDIALLELSSGPDQQGLELLPPLTDDDIEKIFPGNKAIVTGWGSTEPGIVPMEKRHSIQRLQWVKLDFQSQSECQKHYIQHFNSPPGAKPITDNMVCAATGDGSGDACFGDSGGPLSVARGQKKYVQAGIVSWGPAQGCALTNLYGVYTLLPRYRDWVANTVGAAASPQ
jgi:secreted trypsin-like serine protease